MQNKKIHSLGKLFFGLSLLLILNACSDDEPQKQAKKPHNPFDHSHDAVVTDVQKHVFEHDFAEECVAREVSQSNNKEYDKKRFAKPCMCISKYLLKDLTAIEAEKFIKENKSTQSLRIRFENAAYHCLQEKQEPKAPQLFKRR